MNQPKFKIGDNVRHSDGRIFIVNGVLSWALYKNGTEEKTFAYIKDMSMTPEVERELELYQEPEKKKLYAYKSEHGDEVKLTSRECGEWVGHYTDRYFRCSEYDIEYPEAK